MASSSDMLKTLRSDGANAIRSFKSKRQNLMGCGGDLKALPKGDGSICDTAPFPHELSTLKVPM